MGTGVVGLALAQWPGNVPGLRVLAEGLWLFNILLFVLFTGLYTARWVLFFDEARRIFGNSTVSMFFGTISLGLATLRSEERSGGTEGVSPCRSRWSPSHKKKHSLTHYQSLS